MANAVVVHAKRLPQSQKALRAAQYVRMSTDYQQYSIENQAVVIATYAELHKLTIVRTYRDEGESGLKIENRDGLSELVDDVQSGRADFAHLLVFDVSRWGRFQDVDESAHYEFICRKAGVKVAYCAEQFDNDGSLLASIMKNIKRVMAAEFSRELSAKVFAGSVRLTHRGFKMGGPVAYALQRRLVDDQCKPKGILTVGQRKSLLTDHVKLIPGAPDQVEIVKWIFHEYLRHKSQATIARELNRRGIMNSQGRPWRGKAVGDLLRNEAYVGVLTYNRKSRKLGAKVTRNPRELWIRNEDAIAPIVHRDAFRRTQRIMSEGRVSIPEEEMLLRLRKVLMKKGRLSKTIISSSPGLPSISSYLLHFGTLRNIYRLVGYNGNQRWFDKYAAHQRWVALQIGNAARLRDAFEKRGRHATLNASTECLRIDNAVNVVFRVARCRNYDNRPLRWTLQYRARWPKGWIVAVRLDEKNEAVFDYVLMPSAWLTFNRRMFWFSKEFYKGRTINRFDTFEALSSFLVERVGKEKPWPVAQALHRVSRGQLRKPNGA
ncbi:Site-specific DNA recombinase [Bradyrhizobium sp. Rc2d]|uniref:recombinase family protein n=1 Tax=Bradyrhizobium sp. Rc2d TaxID=1855321 RepID=UPI000887F7AE|nr:recombinase family protein [Bradyrhizobium sp. Rc2d]SDG45515.1 Site-specific DNA recombinase [Bradyrhizobium sp. Rc2d]